MKASRPTGGSKKGYKRMEQVMQDLALLEPGEQHMACQVISVFRTGKLSEVEIECIKR